MGKEVPTPCLVAWLFFTIMIPCTRKMDWWYLLFCLLCSSKGCLADNGMDMSMDGSMNLAVGNMLTYLHFTPGDNRGLFIL